MTDRELIERLLFLAETAEDYFIYCELRELAAALEAQPDPQGLMPEVDDILRLAEIIRRVDGNHDKGAAALAEAILSHPDCSYDSPAIEPEPQGPSLAHEAYVAFVQICKGNSDDAGTYEADEELVRRALKRLSDLEVGRPAIEPVPGAKGE
jgi:hypothetical protein